MRKPQKRRKSTKKRESKQRVKNRIRILKFIGCLVITLLTYLAYCALTIPNMSEAINRTRLPSTTIIANNGNEIQSYGTIYSEVVRSEELPQYVVDAIVYTEDHRFYQHFGFDIISFTRAMLTNIFAGRYAQGGSTITQQVAKNLFLTPQKSIRRKVQELMIAFWLEYKFSKEQILTLYLNRVYLGAGTYGIEAASQKYFQKTSRDINIKEAAVIAGMLKAPSRYNPIASTERAVGRAKVVLKIMLEHGLLSQSDYQKVLNMPLGKEKNTKVHDGAYFADWIYAQVNDYIGERDNDIYVLTTLDQNLQERASKILEETIAYNKNKNVSQGAVVILDKYGAIKAMVGGINYNKSQFNRAVQALRQPGSAFKPFVYITALQKGYKPDSIIKDTPLSIKGWKPENADKKYYGDVTLRHALAKSLNLATINLAEQLSIKDIIRNARRMGITTPLQNSPSLALGTMEVKVIDMAAAYASLANKGFAVYPYGIEEIYTRDGYQLYQRITPDKISILDKENVRNLTSMLESVINSGTGRKAALGKFAAGKTGTSQDNRDAWFVGYTNELIAAVWLGNDDNSPMIGVSGANLPAEIWRKIIN